MPTYPTPMDTDHRHHALLRGFPYEVYMLESCIHGSRAKSL